MQIFKLLLGQCSFIQGKIVLVCNRIRISLGDENIFFSIVLCTHILYSVHSFVVGKLVFVCRHKVMKYQSYAQSLSLFLSFAGQKVWLFILCNFADAQQL